MSWLGRLKPDDWRHVERFPLSALAEPPVGVPVVLGLSWYVEFDEPERFGGRWWVARDGKLSRVRGGHCICVKADETDPTSWWRLYDQGREGACVGFGGARMKSLLDRHAYDGEELYFATQKLGGYFGQEGAYVRDMLEVLRTRGAVRKGRAQPDASSLIGSYRWATSVDEVLAVLDLPLASRLGAIPLLNSWGVAYPHVTWMTCEVLDRLLGEDGEAGLVVDLREGGST